ncbi:hypothetical protein L484_000328 [Morus notabilis]|uniref:Uncharacterized protein n=1 Tax=Morus notabilis TaxID=981085 RepID=W9T2Z7_9ROSA|nr:hypothetical protein L484_000328 [Morus notabilis]
MVITVLRTRLPPRTKPRREAVANQIRELRRPENAAHTATDLGQDRPSMEVASDHRSQATEIAIQRLYIPQEPRRRHQRCSPEKIVRNLVLIAGEDDQSSCSSLRSRRRRRTSDFAF